MIQPNLLCCYFPSTAMFLDDNESFLTNLGLRLNAMTPRKLYSDHRKAFNKLEAQTERLEIYIPKMIHSRDQDVHVGRYQTVNVQVPQIYEVAYNRNRFSLISTVFIDYNLVGSTGIDFCRKIVEFPCVKIMLTGEAGYDLAVKAFNEGIIDKFILKDSNELFEEINKTIEWAQQVYFHKMFDQSRLLMEGQTSALKNWQFEEIFGEILSKYSIVEYYLLNSSGSFLLLDKAATPMILTIKAERELFEYVKIAQEHGATAEIMHILQSRKKIPFFFTEDDFKKSPEYWLDYLHDANEFMGENEKYYYSVFPLSVLKDRRWFDRNNVCSFENYLRDKVLKINED